MKRFELVRYESAESLARAAASVWLDRLRSVPLDERGHPTLSPIVPGMGEDGHVASLFPSGPRPGDQPGIHLAVSAPKPPNLRITLIYNVIQCAREVLLSVSGPGREEALRQSTAEGGTSLLARIIQARTATHIMTDLPTSEV